MEPGVYPRQRRTQGRGHPGWVCRPHISYSMSNLKTPISMAAGLWITAGNSHDMGRACKIHTYGAMVENRTLIPEV